MSRTRFALYLLWLAITSPIRFHQWFEKEMDHIGRRGLATYLVLGALGGLTIGGVMWPASWPGFLKEWGWYWPGVPWWRIFVGLGVVYGMWATYYYDTPREFISAVIAGRWGALSWGYAILCPIAGVFLYYCMGYPLGEGYTVGMGLAKPSWAMYGLAILYDNCPWLFGRRMLTALAVLAIMVAVVVATRFYQDLVWPCGPKWVGLW